MLSISNDSSIPNVKLVVSTGLPQGMESQFSLEKMQRI